ncbi:MAG: anhydro-N-acetylmuramic acid kinase, partial [Actinomycetia bacterium]|nr:anhydro-N-acetylmuramic acid kinase [Actinomycetes bacterium]
LLDEPYYRLEPPKSTGKELFTTSYLDQFPASTGLSGPDLVATLTRLTAQTVADAVRSAAVPRLYVSGGGARNPVLMGWLSELVGPVEVLGTDELGLPGDAKEAIAFALLGWCTLHGLPGSVPSVTGAAGPRVLGSITPGAGPLSLPAPVPQVTSATCRVVR